MRPRSPVHVLEALPFDYSRPGSIELRNLLASAYDRPQDIAALLQRVDTQPGEVSFACGPIEVIVVFVDVCVHETRAASFERACVSQGLRLMSPDTLLIRAASQSRTMHTSR